MKTIKLTLQSLLISDLSGNILRFFLRNRVRFHAAELSTKSSFIRGKIVSLLFFKKYEKEEILLIKKYLRKDLPVVDLGASIGAISTNVALQTNQPLICVEASPSLVKVVEQNLVKNNISPDRFKIIQAAIAPHNENGKSLHFLLRGSNELGKLSYISTSETIDVPAISLTQLVDDHLPKDYILISDIEGAESAFLFSDSDQLQRCKQLFIELHPSVWNGKHYSIDDLRMRIFELGFKEITRIHTNFYFERDEQS